MRYLFAYLIYFVSACHLTNTSPHAVYPSLRRDDASNSPSQASASITATTVLSANNTDLTLSFQTLVYYSPHLLSNNSSTLAHISPRQTATSSRRPIDFCKSPTASFLTSYCKYSHGYYVPMQDYTVFCEEDPQRQHEQPSSNSASVTASPSSSSAPHQFPLHHHHFMPAMVTEDGSCNQNEICVDGELGEGVAYCVNKSEFGLLKQLRDEAGPRNGKTNGGRGSSKQRSKGHDDEDDGWIKVRRRGRLGGKVARMVVSGREGLMPMKVGGMDLKAGISGDSTDMIDGEGGDAVVSQEKKCEACFELRSGMMGDDTDFLETQARVMTGGTVAAAAAGVVWLIVSG